MMSWAGPNSEPEELRRCIRDLIALSSLPAIWTDMLPGEIIESVAGSLVSMLDAEFVFVSAHVAGLTLQHAHTRLGPTSEMQIDIRKCLKDWLPGNTQRAPSPIPNPFGDGKLHIASARIGFGGEGVIVAGSLSAGFPTPRQRLLLDTAADQTEEGLRHWRSEDGHHRLSALIKYSSDFIGLADLESHASYLNPAGLKLVGLGSLDEISGISISDFVAEADRERFEDELWPLFLRHGRWAGELSFRHFRGGIDIPVLVDWFRIADPRTMKPLNIATVCRDRRVPTMTETELRRINEKLDNRVAKSTVALAEANERMRKEISERKNASMRLRKMQTELFFASRLSATGQIAASLAHEMSQPLTAATNSLNAAARLLAVARPDSIDLARETVAEAVQQVSRVNQIIKRLRDYVRRGKAKRKMEGVWAIIDEAISLAMIGADFLDAKVMFDFDPKVSVAYVDRIQIVQVLVNLVRNALEAMAESERRELTIRTVPAGNGMIEIAVADCGSGLPREMAEHLFEPFVTSKHKGMGLGLSICRSIVEAHGGKLRSEANPGGGTIFAFTLETTQEAR